MTGFRLLIVAASAAAALAVSLGARASAQHPLAQAQGAVQG